MGYHRYVARSERELEKQRGGYDGARVELLVRGRGDVYT